MNEKLSFQSISDALARKSGVSKKVADTFSKAFFDTIVEALMAGETIKIKGLGTFKLVEVGDRESVNVSTGKRFVIPGYKKVAFTAEDRVVEVLNEHTETESEMMSHTEEIHAEKVDVVETPEDIPAASVISEVSEKEEQDIDTLIQVPEPEQVETPQDAFAGIDMLISTPESVEDIRQQYEEAKAKMETAVEEARKANAEKIRLEKLLERLEKNEVPEEKGAVIVPIAQETPETPEFSEVPVPAGPSEEEKRQEAFKRVMTEQPHTEAPEPQKKKEGNKKFWYITLIVLLVAVLGIFVYLIYRNIEAVEHVQTVEQVKPTKTTQSAQATKPSKPSKTEQPSAPKVDKDSLAKAQKADSIKVAANAQKATQTQQKETPKQDAQKKPDASKEKPQKPETQKPAKEERPKTHRMQRGESLTRISQKYYGTKDSVRAILRVNTFANPDNIPVGAVVKLP